MANLKCPECSKSFTDPRTLGRHRRSEHGVSGQSSAAIAYQRKKGLGKPGKFACPECPNTFDTAKGVEIHRNRMHGVSGASQALKPRLGRPPGRGRKKFLLQDDWWLVTGAVHALREQGIPSNVVLSALRTVHTLGGGR